jgi:uncharacterized protein
MMSSSQSFTAFSGTRQIANGDLRDVAHKAQVFHIQSTLAPVFIFDDRSSEIIEMNLDGTREDLLRRIAEIETAALQGDEEVSPAAGVRGPGRPKLGVVAREITLLPRHWEWLGSQPSGASVALRKLVEQARRANQEKDRLRLAQESAYRFISTMAGDEVGFEEAARALFGGNQERFTKLVEPWPVDVGNHAKKLANRAFECVAAEQMQDVKPRYTLDELLAKCD